MMSDAHETNLVGHLPDNVIREIQGRPEGVSTPMSDEEYAAALLQDLLERVVDLETLADYLSRGLGRPPLLGPAPGGRVNHAMDQIRTRSAEQEAYEQTLEEQNDDGC